MMRAIFAISLLVTSFGCAGNNGNLACDIATALRKAAETGENIACGDEKIAVSPTTVVGRETTPETYTVTIEEGEDNE